MAVRRELLQGLGQLNVTNTVLLWSNVQRSTFKEKQMLPGIILPGLAAIICKLRA
jgi:hypothetical protein